MKHISAILLLSTFLVGCSSLLPKGGPAPRLYTLNTVKWTQDNAMSVIPVSLKIVKPQVTPGLDTERVALRQGANQIDYYADVKWAADAPSLIQSVITDNFTKTRRLKAVSNDLAPLKSDYTLVLNVTDFQMDSALQAHVAWDAKLIRAQDDTVIRNFYYDERQEAAASDMAHIATAFDVAQQHAVEKLVKDTLAVLRHEPAVTTPTQAVTTVTTHSE